MRALEQGSCTRSIPSWPFCESPSSFFGASCSAVRPSLPRTSPCDSRLPSTSTPSNAPSCGPVTGSSGSCSPGGGPTGDPRWPSSNPKRSSNGTDNHVIVLNECGLFVYARWPPPSPQTSFLRTTPGQNRAAKSVALCMAGMGQADLETIQPRMVLAPKQSLVRRRTGAMGGALPQYGYLGSSVLPVTRTVHGPKPISLGVLIPEEDCHRLVRLNEGVKGLDGSRTKNLAVFAPPKMGPIQFSQRGTILLHGSRWSAMICISLWFWGTIALRDRVEPGVWGVRACPRSGGW